MPDLPTGTVTFLFTDIEGSTKLWGQYPEAMKAALARHDALLRSAIEAQGGYVFKTVGDAFCATFDTAPEALAATLAAQRSLHAEAWGQTGELRVRMALHTGAAEEREGDYFGPPLNRVARLLSTGHGGQILLSLATEELVRDHLPEGTTLQGLGEHRLKDLVRPEQVFQLLAPDLPASFPPLKSLDTFPHNLPLQLTSFVGREREMEEVKQRLATVRLLTLTGSGGTGKTRLSLQVAAELLDAFAEGVWLVELAPLSNPQLVPQVVATALGVREEPGQPLLTTLKAYLRDKQILLVLDNCEHLVEACAQLADALLRACPKLRILASSREALGIGGESAFPVPPLSLPDAQHLPPLETLTQYEAVQLFIDRAVAVVQAFAVTNQNAPAVAQVCHRLDGIPLAIELAAARVKVLSAEQIAARLDDRFRLLTGGSRTAQRRQQTLRAAIDWSYDLLSEPERALLRRLSVFAGGWTLEAAEVVGAGEGVEGDEVLDLLAQLIDKSLVIVGEGEASRYRLLETIQKYAQEKLSESGEAELVRGRHLEFFLKLAEQVETEEREQGWGVWLGLEREHDNLRTALEWGLREAGNKEGGLRLAGALRRFWIFRQDYSEGQRWLERALEKSREGPRAVRAKVLHAVGELAFGQSDYTVGHTPLKQSAEIYREVGDKRGIAEVLITLGKVEWNLGDPGSTRARFEESLTIWRELRDKRNIAYVLDDLADLFLGQGNLAHARLCAEESLAICRELGNNNGIAEGLCKLGDVAREQGDYAAARTCYEESLEISRAVEAKVGITDALSSLGEVAQRQGDYATARAHYEESLAVSREMRAKSGIGNALRYLGEVACEQGDYATARARYEESLAIFREVEAKWSIAWALLSLGEVAQRQGDYATARARYEESLAVHREMGGKWGIAASLGSLGRVMMKQGDYATAQTLFGESLALWQEMDFKRGIAYALSDLGEVAHEQGDYATARVRYEESLAVSRGRGSKAGMADALGHLGDVAQAQDDYGQAVTLYRENLTLCREMGNKRGIASCLEKLANTADTQGQPARAARLFGAAEALREAIGGPLWPVERAEYERNMAAVRA